MSATQLPLPPVAIVVRAGVPTVDQVLQARMTAPARSIQTPGLRVMHADTADQLVEALAPGIRRSVSFFNY